MELKEFGADDAGEIRTFVDVLNACSALDSPWVHPETVHFREMELRHGWDGEVGRHFLVEDAGEVVGGVEVYTSEYDNLDLAWLGLHVHPEHRRRGLGSAALEAAYDVSRSMGRTLVGMDGWDSPQTFAFAEAVKVAKKSQAINRRQHLAELPAGLAQRVHDAAAARATDYELLRFEGRSPDELLDGISEMSASINDAPTDDLEIEDEVYPPERIRAYEEAQIASGRRFRRIVARHRASGELAGHTVTVVEEERPELGDQHDTAVVRAHRGHALGALLKSAMMLWLAEEEPQLRTVDTWNAESNAHMIRVNEMLGYRIMGREFQFQRHI